MIELVEATDDLGTSREREFVGTPRSDISLAVEKISAARGLSGTAAHDVLAQTAVDFRMTLGHTASLIVRTRDDAT